MCKSWLYAKWLLCSPYSFWQRWRKEWDTHIVIRDQVWVRGGGVGVKSSMKASLGGILPLETKGAFVDILHMSAYASRQLGITVSSVHFYNLSSSSTIRIRDEHAPCCSPPACLLCFFPSISFLTPTVRATKNCEVCFLTNVPFSQAVELNCSLCSVQTCQ